MKTPKLKNDLITGEDSFNYTQKQFEDKVRGLNQRLSDYNNKVKDNSELNRHIYIIKFIKNELIIEKILHDKKRAKNKGEKNLYKFDKELFCIIIKQKKLILKKKNINKKEKQLELKQLQEKIKEIENKKIFERANKVVVKGRKIIFDYPIINKDKLKIKKIIKRDENDNLDYQYSNTDIDEEDKY